MEGRQSWKSWAQESKDWTEDDRRKERVGRSRSNPLGLLAWWPVLGRELSQGGATCWGRLTFEATWGLKRKKVLHLRISSSGLHDWKACCHFSKGAKKSKGIKAWLPQVRRGANLVTVCSTVRNGCVPRSLSRISPSLLTTKYQVTFRAYKVF